ncbi:hypothetical protein [Amnibacterium setariae]|uniref:hypothetical protein n=1 Tax=Amnibacterium setariae TaxID=2306585 RepID=UPI0011C465F4|nr:hypothetical protein [Amnibacterium setariae]
MIDVLPPISRIKVIDDNPDVRQDIALQVELLNRSVVEETGPLGSLDDYLSRPQNADAAISDHQLKPSGYASFDGADLVASWYRVGFPAILCTSYERASVDRLRSLRRWLPVVLGPNDLDPDGLLEGIRLVQREIHGRFTPQRKPRRALIRFTEYLPDTNVILAKVPGWSAEAVDIRVIELPEQWRTDPRRLEGRRVFATANLEAQRFEDLYVTGWNS